MRPPRPTPAPPLQATLSALIASLLILAGVVPVASAADAPVALRAVSNAGVLRAEGAGARVGGAAGLAVRAGRVRTLSVPSRAGLDARDVALLVQVTVAGAKKPGAVTLWTAGSERPKVAQVAFSAGTSSTTALVISDRRGRISVRSSQSARVSIDVLGRYQGSPTATPGPGGTRIVAPRVLVDRATGRGAWPTRVGREVEVPVLGVGGIPGSGVRAVWLSVQTRSTTKGSLSFRASGTGSLASGSTTFGRGWSTSLVLAPVEQDGTVRMRAAGAPPKAVRVVVTGWVAEQRSGQASSTASKGVVVGPEQRVTVRRTSTASGRQVFRVQAPRLSMPTTAREALVTLQLSSKAPGDLRVGAASGKLRAASSTRVRLARGQTTRLVIALPVRAGTGYVSVPRGTRVVGAAFQGYLGSTASRAADRTAPTVAITSHRDRSTINGATTPRITLAGTVADRGSGVRRVEILGDGVRLGTAAIDTTRRTPRWTFETAVPDGTHRLTATAVDGAGRTTSRTIRITSVAPSAKATVVAPDVEVLPASLTNKVASVDASSVTITGSTPTLEVGDVIVAGSTPATPEGFARKVLSIELTSGRTVLRTEQALLTDIFEQVDVSVRGLHVSEGAAAGHAAPGVSAMQLSESISAKGTVDLVKLAHPDEATKGFVDAKLVYGVDATLAVDMDLKISVKRKGFIFVPVLDRFSLAFSVATSSTTTLSGSLTSAGASKFLSWDHIFTEKYLRPITVQAGPVPVVLTPKFEIAGVGSATFSGGFSTGYTVESSARLGVEYDAAGFRPINEYDDDITGKTTFDAAVKAEAGVEIRVPTRLYDVAGPYIKIVSVADASQSFDATGTTRKAGVSVVLGVGADVTILKKRLGKFEQEWPLLRVPLGDEFIPWQEPTATPTPSPSPPTPSPSPTGTGQPTASPSPSPTPEPTPSPSPTAPPTPLDFGADGTVWAWGTYNGADSGSGGSGGARDTLRRVPGIIGESAAASHWASYVIDTSGDLWTWGQGQAAGRSAFDGSTVEPGHVALPGRASQVTPMVLGAAVLLDNGTVWTWGPYSTRALTGSSDGYGAPVEAVGLCTTAEVVAGDYHVLARCVDGTVEAWGDNTRHQIGPDATQASVSPRRVAGLTGIVDVAATAYGSVALDRDGRAWAWGEFDHSPSVLASPTLVSGVPPIAEIRRAGDAVIALDRDGGVWAWGSNGIGALGRVPSAFGGSATPVSVGGLPVTASLDGGSSVFMARTVEGQTWAWGLLADVPSVYGDVFTATPVRLEEFDGVQSIDQVTSGGVLVS